MNIDEKKIDEMIRDYHNQHRKLSDKPKRTQCFDHENQLARLEGQMFALKMVKMLARHDVNVIEQ